MLSISAIRSARRLVAKLLDLSKVVDEVLSAKLTSTQGIRFNYDLTRSTEYRKIAVTKV